MTSEMMDAVAAARAADVALDQALDLVHLRAEEVHELRKALAEASANCANASGILRAAGQQRRAAVGRVYELLMAAGELPGPTVVSSGPIKDGFYNVILTIPSGPDGPARRVSATAEWREGQWLIVNPPASARVSTWADEPYKRNVK